MLFGQKFGFWKIAGVAKKQRGKSAFIKCKCVCGTVRDVETARLIGGESKSCGCKATELRVPQITTHGQAKGGQETPEYSAWRAMIQRTTNSSSPDWHNYGGRGITVCDRWRHSFENFFEDMGKRPSNGHSIDRIDNEQGYKPGNVRWATAAEQARNTRRTRKLTYDGRTQALTDWATELGVAESTIRSRLKRGWTIAETLSGRKADGT